MPGKWGLHRFYARDERIGKYLPPTAVYSAQSLQSFMNRYRAVYIKPNLAHTGKGIIKAWRLPAGYTYVRVRGGKAPAARTVPELQRRLARIGVSGTHIIQKAIPLAKAGGRPFDIRVMMMRSRGGDWRYVCMLAKVAGPGSIITNVRRGHGYVLEVVDALKRTGHFSDGQIHGLIAEMKSLSQKICRRFDRYKYSRQIGIDYGIDRNGRLWVIEVNFDYPSHALFAGLRDKSSYRKIKEIAATWRKRKRSG